MYRNSDAYVEADILDHRFSHVTCHLIKETAKTHTYIRDKFTQKQLLLPCRLLNNYRFGNGKQKPMTKVGKP